MKNYDRFLAAVKISGCILFWLLFCSMFTQCEKNRALAEGNDRKTGCGGRILF